MVSGVALNGMGGVGKTQFALHYIRHPPEDIEYTLRVWFPSESYSVLSESYRAFGIAMGLPITNAAEAIVIEGDFNVVSGEQNRNSDPEVT